MATTTNYSWTTPDDTALVKDGAAAIRSLGTAIDTTVFTNAGAAIAKSIVDAKGDLIAGTADNTVARLASSASNGDLLTVDTSTATGLKWAAPAASGGMTLLQTLSLSGSSTTSTTLSSSYKQFYVYLYQLLGTETSGFRLRLNGDTGSNYAFNAPEYTTTWASERNAAQTFFRCGYASTSSGIKQMGYMGFTITRPSDTDGVFLQGSGFVNDGGSNVIYYAVTGAYDSSAAITSMTFFPAGGTVTGTAYIYGVN
jgi:hypothetical protein